MHAAAASVLAPHNATKAAQEYIEAIRQRLLAAKTVRTVTAAAGEREPEGERRVAKPDVSDGNGHSCPVHWFVADDGASRIRYFSLQVRAALLAPVDCLLSRPAREGTAGSILVILFPAPLLLPARPPLQLCFHARRRGRGLCPHRRVRFILSPTARASLQGSDSIESWRTNLGIVSNAARMHAGLRLDRVVAHQPRL